MSGSDKKIWWLVWSLTVHVFIGSLLFLVIAAPAIGLEFAIEKLRTILETDSFVINVLTFLKYAILILDALLVLIFLSIQAYKFVREIAA